ncbi:MAG: hypothetical protein JW765_07010 [Deltaproteobacteria bacterium]|nr:hypothetical protein [Candidatus Zymogenaceae bacterium]
MAETPSIRLVSLRCPRCADEIGIGAYDRAYVCRRCLSLWEEEAGSLIEKKMSWIKRGEGCFCYVPFWSFRMEAETPVGRIDDFHAYCGRIAFPELLEVKENRPLGLFVLAAMLSVERYRLSVSRRLTYAQPRFEAGTAQQGRIWGPCVDEQRARNYARIIFISTLSEAYKGSPEFVRGLTIVLTRPRLLYVPFVERRNDFRDVTELITISKKLLPPDPADLRPW